MAPDVLETMLDAGAEEQDLAAKLKGPREPGDEDLVYLWIRRPLIEWALRLTAAAEDGVELRSGTTVAGLDVDDGAALGVALDSGEVVRGDVIIDALGRYRTPPGWPRAAASPTDCGAVYYSRYFRFAEGAHFPPGPWLVNPRGDLGYMGFNTFRGDNRTFAVVLLVSGTDRELRVLRHESAWMAACAAIPPLDVITSRDTAEPITGVLPMGGLSNLVREHDPGVRNLIPVGDAYCHTNPAYAFGMSLSLTQAEAVAQSEGDAEAYYAAVAPEARERHEFSVETDAARVRRLAGEPLDIGHRDGAYPLFAFAAALAAAPHDDLVLRRTVRRIGILDRTSVFDEDSELHGRIERIYAELTKGPPPPMPAREELLSRVAA